MIERITPGKTIETDDKDVVVVMSHDTFSALAIAQSIAFDAEDVAAESGGMVSNETADELREFFRKEEGL